ncbi:putative chromatin-remodeling complex subunit IES6 [Vairimorpha necatrix]|uniref:Chromatin-remodeling complex subunit IES6 n=1 Tax=Vairimorpha necatrix TaxID=6039 RepID=A0AAX4JGD8_9MICR
MVNKINKKVQTRRRNKSIVDSSSTSSEIVENKTQNNFDGIKHYDTINVKKYATYKQKNYKNKNMKTFAKSLDIFSLKYTEIASRFSVRPKKKLCVITGLPAMFICPYTRLPYFDSSVYKHFKTLTSEGINFIYETKDMCKNFNPFINNK